MPLKVRDTFLMANTGGIANPAGAHLMVCLVARTPQGNAIIVPIVSRHERSDDSCLIDVGDHPFIRHESCASYDFTKVISTDSIDADIINGEIALRAPISQAVLVRLQIGFVTSDEVEPWVFDAAYGDKLKIVLKRQGSI